MRGVGNWLALAALIRVPAEIGYEHSHPGTCMCLRVPFFFSFFTFHFFLGTVWSTCVMDVLLTSGVCQGACFLSSL